jgi:anti-sigma-K factor RskA
MSAAPDHERWSEDIGAYVLGALPDREREGFERHLAICPECRREVDELSLAVEALPAGAPPVTPPPELKSRIMAVVDAEAALLAAAGSRADAPEAAPAKPPPRERRGGFFARRFTLRPAFALVACVALLAVGAVGGVLAGGGGNETRTVTAQVAGAAQGAQAKLVVGEHGSELVMTNFPQPPAGRVYQVWTQKPGQNPQPTDVLWTPLADGSATVSVPGSLDGVKSVLVSTEPRGGSAAPTTMPVMSASLS